MMLYSTKDLIKYTESCLKLTINPSREIFIPLFFINRNETNGLQCLENHLLIMNATTLDKPPEI